MNKFIAVRHFVRYRKTGPKQAVGEIFTTVGNTPPEGCMWMEGQVLSRKDYPELYAAIGNSYRRKVPKYNPDRKWYQLWKPRIIEVPEPLHGDFRLPDLRGTVE